MFFNFPENSIYITVIGHHYFLLLLFGIIIIYIYLIYISICHLPLLNNIYHYIFLLLIISKTFIIIMFSIDVRCYYNHLKLILSNLQVSIAKRSSHIILVSIFLFKSIHLYFLSFYHFIILSLYHFKS